MEALVIGTTLIGAFAGALAVQRAALEALFRAMEFARVPRRETTCVRRAAGSSNGSDAP